MEEKREQIRQIDKQICDLLSQRAEVAKELADIKEERDVEITDNDQEAAVTKRAADWMSEFENAPLHASRIFRAVIKFTKNQMRRR